MALVKERNLNSPFTKAMMVNHRAIQNNKKIKLNDRYKFRAERPRDLPLAISLYVLLSTPPCEDPVLIGSLFFSLR